MATVGAPITAAAVVMAVAAGTAVAAVAVTAAVPAVAIAAAPVALVVTAAVPAGDPAADAQPCPSLCGDDRSVHSDGGAPFVV